MRPSKQARTERRARARALDAATSLTRHGAPPKGANRGGGTRLTATQRDSTGARSAWSGPTYLKGYETAMTTPWSQTVNNQNR